MMNSKIIKLGESLGIEMPKNIAKSIDYRIGEKLHIKIVNDSIVIKKINQINLSDMVDNMNPLDCPKKAFCDWDIQGDEYI